MEFLLVIALLGIFVGPSAYRLYERYKRPKRAKVAEGKPGPSYGRRMLKMLAPVIILAILLTILAVALHFLGG